MIDKILNLMGFSRNTYFNWKKEDRPVINLIKNYFSEQDIKEFLETGQITKYHSVNEHHKGIERAFNTLFKDIKDTLDFEGLYLLLKFLNTHKIELLSNINSFNPLLNLGRVPRYNVFLQKKLIEFSKDEEILEYSLNEDFAEFSIYLIELPFEVKLFLYQSFNTDFKYVESENIKSIYKHFKKIKSLEKFHAQYIKMSILDDPFK